jgi:hypothetical protein
MDFLFDFFLFRSFLLCLQLPFTGFDDFHLRVLTTFIPVCQWLSRYLMGARRKPPREGCLPLSEQVARKRGMQGELLKQDSTQKVCFLPSLLSPLPQPFAAKSCVGARRGVCSDFTVTPTCTWRLRAYRRQVERLCVGAAFRLSRYRHHAMVGFHSLFRG